MEIDYSSQIGSSYLSRSENGKICGQEAQPQYSITSLYCHLSHPSPTSNPKTRPAWLKMNDFSC